MKENEKELMRMTIKHVIKHVLSILGEKIQWVCDWNAVCVFCYRIRKNEIECGDLIG